MGFLWVALALVFHAWPMVPVAKGQGTRKDDIVFNSRGVPLAGATVRVCAMPASGQPCTPLALIYSDAALTQAIANPTTSDGLGNYFFYAAPGKYEIEISGPGIATKQLPNVILPSDPSSPIFSSLSTTGAISAFSLNLTGNLTVNGSTTVVGNLASGTLNLTNQAVSPGTAGAGTVNLYTKTVDKRLYYTDDTGAEIGPIANTSGAQTNVTNTFTASQNFDNDVHSKGPNPVFDIMRYGGYVGSATSPQTMTCSINASSTTLSCTSNPDFQNGHGVVVPLAGPLPTLPAAPTPTQVTPIGVINGSTSYSYQYVLEDYSGGLTAAGTSGSTTTGAATLGVNTVALTGVNRVGGVDTFTCASNCNIGVGAQAQISGFSGGSSSLVNGTVVVNSAPTSTTFTVLATGFNDYTETASATASVRACNEIFPGGALSTESVILRSWIYRNGTLAGVSPGQDPFFVDCGQGVGAPSYVPASAPGAASADYLATTIVSGGGTNTMTLANAATRAASSQTVQHDNAPALKAAWTAAYAAHGGVVSIPIIPANTVSTFPFNSTTDLTTIANPTAASVKLLVAGATLNQPWILAPFSELEGVPQSSTSFQYSPLGSIGGNAHPLVLLNVRSAGGIKISKIKFSTGAQGQSAFVADEKVGSGGVVGLILDDDGFSGVAAPAVIIKGGFDFWFTHGVCSVGGSEAAQWFAHPCVDFTNASTYLSSVGTQVPGRIYFERANFQGGTGIQIDNIPASNQTGSFTSGGGNIFLNGVLHDSNAGPPLRIALGTAFAYGITLSDVAMSDATNGLHQPLIEMTGTTNVNNIFVENSKGAGLNPTISGGGSVASPVCINNVGSQGCGQTPSHNISGSNTSLDGGIFGLVNGGSMGYLMSTPAAPASCVVSAGGAVPVTTGLQYFVVAADRSPISFTPFAGMTLLGPGCTVNTTSGNQTVTVTRPALPPGASGWLVWRGTSGGAGEAQMPASCLIPIPASTTTYVDTFGFSCGASPPSTNTAFTVGINSTGVSTGAVTINGEAVTASPRAEQNIFLPGALTTTWTGATWTLDKAVTVTRIQAQAKTAPAGCTTNAVVRVTDGTTPVNVTIGAAANDSGAIAQNYAAGAAVTIGVQTSAAGCTTSPADVNIIVQYRMQ
jgi:hypothetical protein